MDHERRRFKRFDVSLEVSVMPSTYNKELFAGEVKNFSRKGLCFESPDITPALNDPMELKVRMPAGDSYVPVTACVAWKQQLDNRCLVGVEFKEIDKEAKIQILDYAYDLWLEKNRKITSV